MHKILFFCFFFIYSFSQEIISTNAKVYRVNPITIDLLSSVNDEDLQFGLGMGVYLGHNFRTNISFLARPYQKKIYVDVSDLLVDRYLENRYTFGINLDKCFQLNDRFGIYSNLGIGYTYGSYSGTTKEPESQSIYTIGLGLEASPNFRVGYEFANLPNTNQHRLMFTFRFRFLTELGGY